VTKQRNELEERRLRAAIGVARAEITEMEGVIGRLRDAKVTGQVVTYRMAALKMTRRDLRVVRRRLRKLRRALRKVT